MACYKLTDLIDFVSIGTKKLKQLRIGYDFYQDGSTAKGRYSDNRWKRSRIYKHTKRTRGIYKGERTNKWKVA